MTNPNIPFIDLAAQQARIREAVERRIREVLDHGKYIMGPEIAELETRLADYAGVRHCISCASGTDALLLPLLAYGVGPGDAIFTTPFTFIATAEVIALLGATPVFVDIEADTYNIDAAALAKAVERLPKTHPQLTPRGIIPVDLFGQPADYDAINTIARQHKLFVLEDAAQAFGATYKGQRACSLGDVAATSFFPAKPLGCYGDGGAAFTNDDELAAVMRSLRIHGQGSDKYDIGINGRMDTLQAAVLLEKLAIFDEEIELRNRVAARYNTGLAGRVVVPAVRSDRSSVWAQYSVLSDDREGDMARLRQQGVPTAVYYPKPLHLQDAFAHLGHQLGDFPVTESVMDRIFSLPMHPYLDEETQSYIVQALLGDDQQRG